uniref:G-protein coupled receptors family 1 profile domain-containing protein n=1 Tax=Phocoena sinus TaxID=42100 RepID=A0A8C9BSY2_PHOSS
IEKPMSFKLFSQHTGILKTVVWMVAVWVVAFLVHGPIILVSEAWKNGKGDCEPGFLTEWYNLALMVLLEFMIPVLLMAYFNMYIYWSLRKCGNLSRWHSRFTSVSSSSYGRSFRSGLFSRTSFSNPEEAAASLRSEKPRRNSRLLFSLTAQPNSVTASKTGSLSHSDSRVLQQREHLELCRGRKLAKSLAILLGVFATCWAPYSLFTIISVYEFTFWLQRFNSFDNPFLYSLCHKRFQKAFLKIFCVKKQSIPSHNRSTSS